MVYDSGSDSATDAVLVATDASYVYSEGVLYNFYHAAFGSKNGQVFRCIKDNTATAASLDLSPLYNGIIYNSRNMLSANRVFQVWNGNGFGDNNQFEIYDNQTTILDDNGNSAKVGTASFNTQFFIDESSI
jgi:hypothetical protein